MRIDLLITELDFGGAEQCLVRLAVFLQKEGLQVRVLALGVAPSRERNQLVADLQREKIAVVFLGGKGILSLPRVVWSLRKHVDRDPPVLVQSFLFHANLLTAWIYGRRQIPYFMGYRVAEPRKWRYRLERWASRRMEQGVPVSQDVARWCRELLKIDARRLCVIENGVTPSRLLDRELVLTDEASAELVRLKEANGLPVEAPYLLFAGRLVHQKGVDRLLEQAPEILGQLSGHHLVLMGDGMDSKILNQFAKLPDAIRNRVHRIGWSSSPRHWMAGCDILLLPTRYEGMPNVLLEAMAEGRAVAVMEAEGVREAIGTGGLGQVVAQGDIRGWTELIVRLGCSAELRNSLGVQNLQRVESVGNWDAKSKLYLDLYRPWLDKVGSC